MAAYEVLLLNTAIPQIQAAQSGDTYVVPRDIAINATAIISANSATDALRITQTGTGNALLVEDSANPDSSPFVVTATGNVGIGASSPGAKLDIVTSSTIAGVRVNNTTAGKSGMVIQNNGSTVGIIGLTGLWNGDSDTNFGLYAETGSDIRFSTNGVAAPKAIIDTSGNLGLGVTPSAWASFTALQFGETGCVASNAFSSSNTQTFFGNNVYYDGAYRYIATGSAAAQYIQIGSEHRWNIAASGTAGDPISFTQVMTLDASGNLVVGDTANPDSRRLRVYGVSEFDGNGVSLVNFKSSGTKVGSAGQGDYVVSGGPSDGFGIQSQTALVFGSGGSTERARITSGGIFQVSSGGSVQVGGTAARATTAGTNRLDIFNGTAPVGTLTDGISIYSSSGEAYVMDAAGNATLFSPHDAETNEWIFKSKHTPTGKVLKIDVERLLKFVNDHFGLDAVHEFVEE